MTECNSRMQREKKTVRVTIKMYCNGCHDTGKELCGECKELLEYALSRLDKCPFQKGKTTCAKCPIHCYKPEMREKIRNVMRYSGPRMFSKHPILALFHFMDGTRKKPVK